MKVSDQASSASWGPTTARQTRSTTAPCSATTRSNGWTVTIGQRFWTPIREVRRPSLATFSVGWWDEPSVGEADRLDLVAVGCGQLELLLVLVRLELGVFVACRRREEEEGDDRTDERGTGRDQC